MFQVGDHVRTSYFGPYSCQGIKGIAVRICTTEQCLHSIKLPECVKIKQVFDIDIGHKNMILLDNGIWAYARDLVKIEDD